jgi:hypothetical protein
MAKKRKCKYGRTKAGTCRKKRRKAASRGGKRNCRYGVAKTGKRKGQCLKSKRAKKR